MRRLFLLAAVVVIAAVQLYATSGSNGAGTGAATGATVDSILEIHPTALLLPDGQTGALVEQRALRETTGANTYLTSAAVYPGSALPASAGADAPQRVIVATTFHGIFETRDGGATWFDLGDAGEIDALYVGDGFFEDIAAVAYDPEDEAVIWVEYAQDGTIAAIDRRTGTTVPRDRSLGSRALASAQRAPAVEQPPLDAAAQERRRLATGHTSFYLSPWQLAPEQLDGHMAFAREHGFTAVVIDFKDDLGRLIYDSQLQLHDQVGAVRGFTDARRVIDTVHRNGLYLIARVVVFKDRELYLYDGNRYALWDRRLDAPWGVFRQEGDEETGETVTTQVEYWVDPFSEFVWDYNIEVASELQELGVDEIQFDYIRTPADGRTRDIAYRFHGDSPAMENDDPYRDDRVEALSAFLQRARRELTVPIGIDVFGFNGWYRMSYLGQDIALLARYVDVISPMLYPSHFPRAFNGGLPYLEWAEWIYRDGVARGRRITEDHALIRPYVQAFLIGGELEFELSTYTEYLKRQIRGALNAEASGFTLWNNSGRYYMVERGLWFPDGPRIVGR